MFEEEINTFRDVNLSSPKLALLVHGVIRPQISILTIDSEGTLGIGMVGMMLENGNEFDEEASDVARNEALPHIMSEIRSKGNSIVCLSMVINIIENGFREIGGAKIPDSSYVSNKVYVTFETQNKTQVYCANVKESTNRLYVDVWESIDTDNLDKRVLINLVK